eukprot:364871-Chlamydomonas_euryale.AAC.3
MPCSAVGLGLGGLSIACVPCGALQMPVCHLTSWGIHRVSPADAHLEAEARLAEAEQQVWANVNGSGGCLHVSANVWRWFSGQCVAAGWMLGLTLRFEAVVTLPMLTRSIALCRSVVMVVVAVVVVVVVVVGMVLVVVVVLVVVGVVVVVMVGGDGGGYGGGGGVDVISFGGRLVRTHATSAFLDMLSQVKTLVQSSADSALAFEDRLGGLKRSLAEARAASEASAASLAECREKEAMYVEQHDALKAAFREMTAEREHAFALLGEHKEADAQRVHEMKQLQVGGKGGSGQEKRGTVQGRTGS